MNSALGGQMSRGRALQPPTSSPPHSPALKHHLGVLSLPFSRWFRITFHSDSGRYSAWLSPGDEMSQFLGGSLCDRRGAKVQPQHLCGHGGAQTGPEMLREADNPLGCSSLLGSEVGGRMAGESGRGCSETAGQLRSACPHLCSQ